MEIINTFNPIMQKYGNKIGVFCGWLETFRCVWNDFFKQKYGFVDKSGISFNSAKGIVVSDFVSFHMFLGVNVSLFRSDLRNVIDICELRYWVLVTLLGSQFLEFYTCS